jgi:hypothetical protein
MGKMISRLNSKKLKKIVKGDIQVNIKEELFLQEVKLKASAKKTG